MSLNGVTLDELTADAVEFDNTGAKIRATVVSNALIELRNEDTKSLTNVVSTLNGTTVLTVSSNVVQSLTGTATGFSFQLPVATTLFIGRRFEFINNTTKSISIKNSAGTILFTLITGDILIATLQDNTTSIGSWLNAVTSSTSAGITNYALGSDTAFTTSSNTDILITGMTVTPISGRYVLWYSADVIIGSNNRKSQVVVYVNGIVLSRTRRTAQGIGSNYSASHNTISADINVNGSQAIDIRVNINSGSVDINQRQMILIRQGAAV